MANKKQRIGVVGLGRIGWNFHCRTLAEHPDFELVAVVDASGERRVEAHDVYGCRAYPTLNAMCTAEQLDVAVVATPTHLHKQHTLTAIEHGCHVMLEKPAATTCRQAQAIGDAAAQHGRVLTVYQPHRAKAWYQQALKLINAGRIGEVYHVKFGLFSYARRNDWQSLRKFGGGMLNNYGAHALDLLLNLTGYDVARVMCNLRRVASLGDTEDVVKIVYETGDGVIGEVDINQACAIKPYEFEAYGTRGTITRHEGAIHVRRLKSRRLPQKKLDVSLASAGRAYPRDDFAFATERIDDDPRQNVDVYRDFAKAIRRGGEPFVTFDQTLALMRVVERCRREARGIHSTPLAT